MFASSSNRAALMIHPLLSSLWRVSVEWMALVLTFGGVFSSWYPMSLDFEKGRLQVFSK
jgi:hypothetical protein